MTTEFASLKGEIALVTGGTGFVGRHLVRRLAAVGAKPRVLARKSNKNAILEEFSRLGAEIVYGDICRPEAVRTACRNAGVVFHLAALFREAKHADSEYFAVNVEGTRNVLAAAQENGVKRVIYCSTCGVHGSIEKPPADENEPFHPCDVYQESKARAEELARSYFEQGRPPGVIIRPAMIWGEEDRRLLKLFRGVARRRFPIIGGGNMLTHWVYVHDLVDGMLLAAEKEQALGQSYILAGREALPLKEVVQIIADLAGVEPLPFRVPFWPVYLAALVMEKLCVALRVEPWIHRRRVEFFVKNRAYSIEKAGRDLGYSPRYDVREEARRIYAWYKEHGWL